MTPAELRAAVPREVLNALREVAAADAKAIAAGCDDAVSMETYAKLREAVVQAQIELAGWVWDWLLAGPQPVLTTTDVPELLVEEAAAAE